MKKALIILVATVTAAISAAPAMAGGKGFHRHGFFKPSFHNSFNDHNSYDKKRAAQRRAAQRRAAARRAAARRAAAKKAAAQKAQHQVKIAKVATKTEASSDWQAPVKASAIAGANTLKFRKNAPTTPVKASTEPQEQAVAAAEVAELECKRYIASAGMTVTVPCGR